MSDRNPRAVRQVRHVRVRRRIAGTTSRPRLCVFRSLNHIHAQVVDDSSGQTLAAMSTLDAQVRSKVDGMAKVKRAEIVGVALAEKVLEKGIRQVVFDRGGYRYHGRVKALAEGARQAGLEF